MPCIYGIIIFALFFQNLFMKKLSLTHLNRVSVEEFKRQQKLPLIVVLDNIRSALNVGSAFRTSDAFALEKVILCGITAQPPHREILKTAIGATEAVDWEYLENTTDALEQLRSEDVKLIAIEQAEESVTLNNFQVEEKQKYALVFGNEVKGVSQAAMDMVDECIEIPQFGTKHSLNISVCVGIVIWDFFHKMNK